MCCQRLCFVLIIFLAFAFVPFHFTDKKSVIAASRLGSQEREDNNVFEIETIESHYIQEHCKTATELLAAGGAQTCAHTPTADRLHSP